MIRTRIKVLCTIMAASAAPALAPAQVPCWKTYGEIYNVYDNETYCVTIRRNFTISCADGTTYRGADDLDTNCEPPIYMMY